MRKLQKAEKMMIAMSGDNYTTYDCTEHGIFQNRKDVDNGKCPYPTCKGNVSLVENTDELKAKYKLELGI